MLPSFSEGLAILSAVRTLRTLNDHYGLESEIDYVTIHGRVDLHERLQKEQFATEVGIRVLWHEGPALGGAAMALGVALGCLAQNTKAFDLSKALKPRPSILEIFPWGELAFEVILVACMAGLLGVDSVKLEDAYAKTQSERSQHSCLYSIKPAHWEKEAKKLEDKIEIVHKFLETQILWTSYMNDIPHQLPATTKLKSFKGICQPEITGRSGGLKNLALQVMAPATPTGAVPHEINAILKSLRNDPVSQHDFSTVEVADMKMSEKLQASTGASYSIKCSSKK
jgi:hypothetical protein